MQSFFTYIFSVLILALALPCEGKSASSLSPEALVTEALAHNAELNFYRAEIAAAKGGLKTAGTRRNPELNLQAGYKNTRDKSGSTLGDGAAWSLSVNQSFEYPGRIALRKAVVEGDVDWPSCISNSFGSRLRRAFARLPAR